MIFKDRTIQLRLNDSSHGSTLLALDRHISAHSPDTSRILAEYSKGEILKVPLEDISLQNRLINSKDEVVNVLREFSFNARGCDLKAKPELAHLQIDQGDITKLPYPNSKFNLVLCINFICRDYFEFGNRSGILGKSSVDGFDKFYIKALEESLRVLKQGGLLVISALSSCNTILKGLDPKRSRILYQSGGEKSDDQHLLIIKKQ